MEWIFLAIGVVVGALVSLIIALAYRASNKKKLAYAQQEAKRILAEAIQSAAATKKEAILETKEAVLAMKNEAEEELKERRKEVSRQERRIAQKEETLDHKTEALEQKHAALQKKHEEAEALKEKINETLAKQLESLEKYSGLTAEEAKHHPSRNYITRAVGTERTINPQFYEVHPQKGDVILLCTDGLSNMVEDSDLANEVMSGRSPQECVKRLVAMANDRGGPDNITVTLLAF